MSKSIMTAATWNNEIKWMNGMDKDDWVIAGSPGVDCTDFGVYSSITGADDFAGNEQVGGTHYVDMGLQPIEATYLRYGYAGVKAALHCKIDKYINRNKNDEALDLEKALHCVELLIAYHDREGETK